MAELDKRLGRFKEDGSLDLAPTQSISGADLPHKPYQTIGIENGYFAILDTFISPEKRDTLVIELRGVIKAYALPKKQAVKSDE